MDYGTNLSVPTLPMPCPIFETNRFVLTDIARAASRTKKDILIILAQQAAVVLHYSFELEAVLPRTEPSRVFKTNAYQNVIFAAPKT